MSKNLTITVLLDFYGELLTAKQADALRLYYDEDCSLSEIADDMGISRQGARDFIKRGEQQLFEFEEKLGLARRFEEITKAALKLEEFFEEQNVSDEAKQLLERIKDNL